MSAYVYFPVESLPAHSTGIRTNPGVTSLMSQHVGGLTETLSTHIALVRFRAGMCDHVFAEVRLPKKTHVALSAFEGLGIFMDEPVVRQTAGALEPFQTELALVFLDFFVRGCSRQE